MVVASVITALGWAPSVILLILLLIFTFFLLAIVCDEALAPTLEELSSAWKIPHDVACATFLAAGSSAPEIAISIMSVVHGKKNSLDLSLGALMGSALIAFTVIPACCVVVSPGKELKLDLVPLVRDIAFYCAGLLWLIYAASDEAVTFGESLVLVIMFFLYLLAMKLLAPFYKHTDTEHHFLTEDAENQTDTNGTDGRGPTTGGGKYGTISEGNEPVSNGHHRGSFGSDGASVGEDDPTVSSKISMYIRTLVPPFNIGEDAVKSQYSWIMFVSIFYISILSELALYFAETLSDLVGVPHHLTGLVLVALGAQNTVASMAVAKHGEGPSSIANAIGSQVLNINLGIGFPFLVSTIIRSQPVELLPSSDSGHLIFATVIFFLTLVLVERITLKLRDAMLLFAIYGGVVVIFYFSSLHKGTVETG